MQSPPIPADEPLRIAALRQLGILDTPPEERFDRITRLAQLTLQAPIALISLVDTDRQWFKSCVGLAESSTSRDASFCAHAILGDAPFIIPDALADPRFSDNPLVRGEPFVRFYLGIPLHGPDRQRVGTLCVLDQAPRTPSGAEIDALTTIAHVAESELNHLDADEAHRLHAERLDKANAELQHERDFAVQVMNTMSQGLSVMDVEGRFQYINPAFGRLIGTDPQSWIGKSPFDLTVDEDHGKVRDALERRRQGQRVEYEARLRRTDGSLIYALLSGGPVTRDGAITGSITVITDLTERRQAEERLQETLTALGAQFQEAELARSESRAVLDAASEAMILVSPKRWIITVNRRFAELFGRTTEEVVGHHFSQFRDDVNRVFGDPEEFRNLVAGSASDPEGTFTDVIQQVWPQPRELQIYGTPVRGSDDTFIGRLYVLRDVTREREVDRMKTEFVSMVSHELRTPLTSIKGYVDLLLEEGMSPLDDEQREFLGVVKSNADRLVALINDLLDVSRIEAGKVDLKRSALDLDRQIYAVAVTLRPQIEAKRQRLTIQVQEGIPAVLGDQDRVTQILTNLLSNAHKYTATGGSISIRVTHEVPEAVTVSVQDSGIGMTPDEMAQLFTKFFRARNRTTQEVGGTGLGLAITKSLVTMHGGEMQVASTAGEGSTFSFTLPTAGRIGEEDSGAGPRLGGRTHGTVLVVDDEPDIARLLERYLTRVGFQVMVADSGVRALELARAYRPSLVTLDLKLPDADGFAVLQALKAHDATRDIPVLLLSIEPDSGRGALLGAGGFLTKPVKEADLLAQVRSLIRDAAAAEALAVR